MLSKLVSNIADFFTFERKSSIFNFISIFAKQAVKYSKLCHNYNRPIVPELCNICKIVQVIN